MRMRVLWLSMNPGLYGAKGGNDAYNGGGWISSLQRLIKDEASIELGLAFITESPLLGKEEGNTTYFPILQKKTSFQKIAYYYGGYKHEKNEDIKKTTLQIINSFQPDIIHLFGLESPFTPILGNTDIPVIVHLQGILGPVDNAYLPCGISTSAFIWPPRIREWILRNDNLFMHNFTKQKAEKELSVYKQVDFAMGRTSWDKHITELLSPKSQYFHVDEVLRPCFYDFAGKWTPQTNFLQILSTISVAPYKGLDLILKTAKLLTAIGIKFRWKVVGIDESSPIVTVYERQLHIKSKQVGIVYNGVMSGENLCNEILDSTLYVHPSYIDNSPNSLCEAQMLGIPCISTNVGGTSSLIRHSNNGLLIPANGVYELAYYIQRIASDIDEQKRLSEAGYATAAKRHDKQNILQQLLSTYNNLVNFK